MIPVSRISNFSMRSGSAGAGWGSSNLSRDEMAFTMSPYPNSDGSNSPRTSSVRVSSSSSPSAWPTSSSLYPSCSRTNFAWASGSTYPSGPAAPIIWVIICICISVFWSSWAQNCSAISGFEAYIWRYMFFWASAWDLII